jgi:hypothetical protein
MRESMTWVWEKRPSHRVSSRPAKSIQRQTHGQGKKVPTECWKWVDCSDGCVTMVTCQWGRISYDEPVTNVDLVTQSNRKRREVSRATRSVFTLLCSCFRLFQWNADITDSARLASTVRFVTDNKRLEELFEGLLRAQQLASCCRLKSSGVSLAKMVIRVVSGKDARSVTLFSKASYLSIA